MRNSPITEFLCCLKGAMSEIDSHYIQLPVDGYEHEIIRERVYSYELYHQLRTRLGNTFPYKLNGELDKEGHPLVRHNSPARKPDLVCHVPGEDRNLIVIEIKANNARTEGIRKDIDSIHQFLSDFNYEYGALVIYGNGEEDIRPFIRRVLRDHLRNCINICMNQVFLIWHPGYGKEPCFYFGPSQNPIALADCDQA